MKENGTQKKIRSPINVIDSAITKHGVRNNIHRKATDTNILEEIQTTIRLTVQQEMQRILDQLSKQSQRGSSKDVPNEGLEPVDMIEIDKSNDEQEASLLKLERQENETGPEENEINNVILLNEDGFESHGEEGGGGMENKDIKDVAMKKKKKKKKTRGPTNCKSIHARKLEDREVIKVNKEGQPIVDSNSCNGFSRFLGTLARNSRWVPFACSNWRNVGAKEKEALWDYVNTKYIVPKEAKSWVLRTIANAWRVYKSRLKKQILKYKTHEERLKHRPQNISEKHFDALLEQWSYPNDQERSFKNKQNRQMLRNVHRAGPKSIARIQEESMTPEYTYFHNQENNTREEKSQEIGRKNSSNMNHLDGRNNQNCLRSSTMDNEDMVVGKNIMDETRKNLLEDMQSKMERQTTDFVERLQLAVAILQHCNPNMVIPPSIIASLVHNLSYDAVKFDDQEHHLGATLNPGIEGGKIGEE